VVARAFSGVDDARLGRAVALQDLWIRDNGATNLLVGGDLASGRFGM
jgi:hypothetical protein